MERIKEGRFLMRKWKINEQERIERIENDQMTQVRERVEDIKESELSILKEMRRY